MDKQKLRLAIGDRSCDRWNCRRKTRTDDLVCMDAVKQLSYLPRLNIIQPPSDWTQSNQ